jgi:assimilatory nitrate reductase catalytic subunit
LLAVSVRGASRYAAPLRAGIIESDRERRRAVLLSGRQSRFVVPAYRPPAEETDEEFPIILTTGRVVSQFLSGTQTRRIGPLVDQYPEPRVEIHPRLAQKYGIADGDWTTVESRRGTVTLRAQVVTSIRPDTVFIPYHWPGRKSANQLTIAAQDPVSKIPEYKVCAVRLRKSEKPADDAEPAAPGAAGSNLTRGGIDDAARTAVQQGR